MTVYDKKNFKNSAGSPYMYSLGLHPTNNGILYICSILSGQETAIGVILLTKT